jgi:hypothetical protein
LNQTPDQRESLKRFGSNFVQLPVDASGQHVLVVGSACSGSGMDMIVLNVYADWVKKLAGLQLVVKHACSCEKQQAEAEVAAHIAPPARPVACQCQRFGSRRWVPVNGSDEVKDPNIDKLFRLLMQVCIHHEPKQELLWRCSGSCDWQHRPNRQRSIGVH